MSTSTTDAAATTGIRPRTKEEREAINTETTWTPLAEAPTITTAELAAIVQGKKKCPHCHGSYYTHVACKGETTGVTLEQYYALPCRCVSARMYWVMWKSVPDRFRGVNLDKLQPRDERQAQVLALFRNHPKDSFFMFGPPGTGKTHLSFGLYNRVVKAAATALARRMDYCPHVWRVTTSVLLNEHVERERTQSSDDPAPLPTVAERMIRNAAAKGYRPSLFLDEIDKFPPSEFKLDRLGEIVNAVYESRGQVVATSNADIASLTAKWAAAVKGSTAAGGTILRRIGADDRGHLARFA